MYAQSKEQNNDGAESQLQIPLNLDATPMSGIETLATAAEYVERGLVSSEAPATDHGKNTSISSPIFSEDRQSRETASPFQRVDYRVTARIRSEHPIAMASTPYVGTRTLTQTSRRGENTTKPLNPALFFS